MKNGIRLLALSLAAATIAYPAPFLAAGDGAELFLTGTLGVRSDDNVFLTSDNELDDVIFDINPGVDLTFGKDSLTQGNISFVESFARYSQNNRLNTDLAGLNFASNYDDGKTKFAAQAGYNELNQNSVDVRGLVRRDVSNAGLNGETSVSAKSKVGAGIKYNNIDYKRAGYVDQSTFEVPVNYYYAVTSKVDLSLGLRYRSTEVQTGIDSKDMFYRIGARGEFSPKVTGSVMVGYGQRDFDVGGSKDLFDLDALLTLAVSAKSALQFTASNDFGVSSTGLEQKNLSLGANVLSQVSDQLSLRGGLNWRSIDYYTRTDDYVEIQLGVDYMVSNNVTLQGAYAYRNNNSDLAGGDFTNNVFSLSAQFRY